MSAYSDSPLDPEKVARLETTLFEIYKGAGVPVRRVRIVAVGTEFICQAIMVSPTRGEYPMSTKLPPETIDKLRRPA